MTDLFGHSVRSELLVLYVIEALACFTGVYCLIAWTPIEGVPDNHGYAAVLATIVALLAGATSGAGGLYYRESWSHLDRLLAGTAVATLLLTLWVWPLSILLHLLLPGLVGHRLAWLLAVFAVVVVLTRLGFAAAVRCGILGRRVAVVSDACHQSTGDLATGRGESVPYEVVLTLHDGASLIPQDLRTRKITEVVVADTALDPAVRRQSCESAGLRVFSEVEFQERQLNRVNLERLPDDWLASAKAAHENRLEGTVHRSLDIVISVVLLIVAMPVLLLAALAIKLDSAGPVLYRQERVGLGGRVFTLFKFRSMIVDAEQAGVPRWASRRDPRVTRVGRFIRLTRIDEVPQVLNVLLGDMAFVGPRPERPAFVAQLSEAIPHYRDRACVKPGITGWAQVNYPYGASVEDARMKLAYDLYYIRRRSLFLDVLILISTINVVVFQKGAR